MHFKEIHTLIIGIIVVGTLTIIYLKNYFKTVKIKKYIVYGDKKIKRTHYILKKYGYRIVDVEKRVGYRVITAENKIYMELKADIIAKKDGEKALVVYDEEESINYKTVALMILLKTNSYLIIDTDAFSLKWYKVKF